MSTDESAISSAVLREQHGRQLHEFARRLRDGHNRSRDALSLVPSENRLSPLAQLPLQLDFHNRYFFNEDHDPDFWQFRGGESVADIETDVAHSSLSALSDAPFVNLRPVSGLSAMIVAISGLGGDPGSTVVCIDPASGGHHASAGVIERFGFVPATVSVEAGAVDIDGLRKILSSQNVSLLYLDLANSLHLLDVAAVAACLAEHSPHTLLHIDASHTLGLILGGQAPNPLDLGATSFGGSTHKTFPGPHKGVLFTRLPHVSRLIKDAQRILVSSHHFASTLALGLAAREFQHFGPAYARQVVANAKRLGAELTERGFDVHRCTDGFTDNHMLWVNVGDPAATNKLAGALAEAGIRANVQTENEMPNVSGAVFRLGTNEVTFEGATETSMALIAEAFAAARDGAVDRAAKNRSQARQSFESPYFFADTE
ncbi:hypothetical protein [Streptomyces sp. T21Q-yed]|uniref:hypothetical protein n=1 Tax=Streptomyces sp. T21Q-yed TaxID=3018441 RepID=UPI0023E0019A|nr:hypothetical protein [Streptomyces sp. T21Q-yed]